MLVRTVQKQPSLCMKGAFKIYTEEFLQQTVQGNKNKSEKLIEKEILQFLGCQGLLLYRTEIGRIRLPDGKYFTTGLPKGHPDIYGLNKDNTVFYLEVKTPKGRPSKEQVNFMRAMKRRNVTCGFVRSKEEALHVVTNKLSGYGLKQP